MRDRDTLSQHNTPTFLFHSHVFLHWESTPCSERLSSLLAWLDVALPVHHGIFLSNMWVVAVWTHTTGTSLQHFLIGSDPTESSFLRSKAGPLKLLPESTLPYLFFRVSPSRCLVSHPVISNCHLLSVFHYLFHNVYIGLGLSRTCSLLVSVCLATRASFLVWTELVALRVCFATS